MKKILLVLLGIMFCLSFVSAVATQIHFTGFEDPPLPPWDGWVDGGTDCLRSASLSTVDDSGTSGGSASIEVQDDSATSYTSQVFDLSAPCDGSACDEIILSFYVYPNSYDKLNEGWDVFCDYGTGDEVNIAHWAEDSGNSGCDDVGGVEVCENVWTQLTINLSDQCVIDSAVEIMFTGQESVVGLGNADQVYIDGVNLTGHVYEGSDSITPNVTELLPVSGSTYNISDVIEIAANVSDDVNVSYVFANITLGNGSVEQLELSQVGSTNKYNESFVISVSGRHAVQIIANDTSNNLNASGETSFDVDADFTYLLESVFGYLSGTLENVYYYLRGLRIETGNQGNYTSQVFDAGQNVSWSNISWSENLAGGTVDWSSRTCADTWGSSCSGCTDNTMDSCASSSCDGFENVQSVTVNATSVRVGDKINVSVVAVCNDASSMISIAYYNGSWSNVYSSNCINQDGAEGHSVVIETSGDAGTQWVRGMDQWGGAATTCVTGFDGDNDDANFTVLETAAGIEFQARTDDDDSGWEDFTGPDGTSASFYTNNTFENLNVSDARYFQYKAFFDSLNEELYNVTIGYGISCTESLQNTTWSGWQNYSVCLITDEQQQNRSLEQYDENDCGYVNETFWDWQNVSCNYCSYNNTNTTWSEWQDYGSCLITDEQEQNRSRVEYDDNYGFCYTVTGLPSDLWNDGNNITHWGWQNTSCDYCTPNRANTTWGDWHFLEVCQIDDTRERQRNRTEYDENNCYAITGLPSDLSENVTYFENDTTVCDYCTPNPVNTTWTDWQNYSTCLLDDNQQQNRSKIEYDENICYDITGLPADEFNNVTYWEWRNISCDYCTPDLVNTTWSDWENLTCVGDEMNQSRFLVQYDQNDCGEIENQTFYEYQFVGPDYLNTTWSGWYNITLCLEGDYYTQERNRTQYDAYSCAANSTFYEYQNLTCDYCVPDTVNTTKTAWQDYGSCLITDEQQQNRSWEEYDQNNCEEVANTTYWEWQNISCDYCQYSIVNTTWSEWENVSCLESDLMNQSRFKTEYDENYSTCYSVTGLPSDLWNDGNNITYWEYRQTEPCDYCTPDLMNTTWSDWANHSCIDGKLNQSRFLVQYDQNNCEEIANETFYEYRSTIDCDETNPDIEIISPQDTNYTSSSVLVNISASDDNLDSIWFYNGSGNVSYTSEGYFEFVEGVNTLIAYVNDTFGNENSTSVSFEVVVLNINCEVGGPYQSDALVLVQGNVSNSTSALNLWDVNISVYDSSDSLVELEELVTASDGSFETSFSDLASGSYSLNATTVYKSFGFSCSDSFELGGGASFILDKLATIHNVTNTTIYYNVSLRLTNKGLGESSGTNISDSDSEGSPYLLGEIGANETVTVSYLKNFARQDVVTYVLLGEARAEGIDAFSGDLVWANSSSINVTIPATQVEKQIVITKNSVYLSEESFNVTYNVSSTLYNSGGEDLEDVVYIDTDISDVSILVNLSKGSSIGFANEVVVDKAASNTEHEFALGTATVDTLTFYSNRPKVSVPGYGGPADLIVDVPASVNAGETLNLEIELKNMNPNIGQDFVLDYWITNEVEDTNYSSGQQTLYVAANGTTNASAGLTAPSTAGTYRLRAKVSWVGGSATGFDSFEVVSGEEPEEPEQPPIGGGGGGGELPIFEEPVVNETEVEGNVTVPEEPEEEEGEGVVARITGFFVDLPEAGKSYYVIPVVLFLVLIIIIWRIWETLRKRKRIVGRLKHVRGMKVYTSCGTEIGRVKELMVGEKVEGLRINLLRKKKFRVKKIEVRYKHVHCARDVVIVDEKVLEKLGK